MKGTILVAIALLVAAIYMWSQNQKPADPATEAVEKMRHEFDAQKPEAKFRWIRDVQGMSTIMRLRQIDAITNASLEQKLRWKAEIQDKYKDIPINEPTYKRG